MPNIKLTQPENSKQSLIAFLIACSILLMTFFYQIAEETQQKEKVISHAQIVTNNVAIAMLYEDTYETNQILESLRRNEEIILICVFNDQGKLITSLGKPNFMSHISCGSRSSNNTLTFTHITPIFYKDQKLGELELHVSKDRVYTNSLRFMYGLLIIGITIWAINVFAIKKMEAQITGYETKLQKLINKRDEIIDAEHRKIAIEIHDQVGQLLSSANFNIRYLKTLSEGQQQQELLTQTETILSEVYTRVKNISTELHPAILDFGIQAAVEWLAEKRLAPNNIEWRIRRNRELKKLDPKLANILFKITQEAFTNILKHSHATMVIIDLHLIAGKIVLAIRDNGIGAKTSNMNKNISLGLVGITERARAVHGDVIFKTDITGTTLTVSLPTKEPSHVKH
jgi:signal transduction histidine kinase